MRPKRLLVVAAVFLSAVFFSREAWAERKIGILMFSEETRYNEAMNGITDRLREAGFSEPGTRLIVENAGANKARAAEKVVRILKGASPSSVPIESPKELHVMINLETARRGRFRVPEEFMKKVTRKVD